MKFLPTVIFTLAAVSSTATAAKFSPKNLRGRRHLSSESVPSAPSVDSVSSEDDRRHLSSVSAPSEDSVSSEDDRRHLSSVSAPSVDSVSSED
eukprot:scaffold11057_cov66-Skeletonema_marinoi.AAC.1